MYRVSVNNVALTPLRVRHLYAVRPSDPGSPKSPEDITPQSHRGGVNELIKAQHGPEDRGRNASRFNWLDEKETKNFGRNSLIAGRLLEAGVRFMQVWS